jgi:acetylornithine deacetylase
LRPGFGAVDDRAQVLAPLMAAQLDTATDLLRDLIAFDTTSCNSNMPLIEYVADYLSDNGISPRVIPSDDGTKANLFATIGPDIPGGVVLSGHSDVVPVDGQDWSTDPFDLTESDGRLYGRGSADMKGFIACTLALAPKIFGARSAPAGPSCVFL